MSTMRTDLLQNRLGTSHPDVTKAAFVHIRARYDNFSGNVLTVLNSFNASGFIDNSAGNTTFSVTSPFATAGGWSIGVAISPNGSWTGPIIGIAGQSASSLNLVSAEGAPSVFNDRVYNNMLGSGVLA